jgi:lysozyme
MKTSQSGIDLIKHFEGYSSTTYLDSAGYPTIGYGHLAKPNDPLVITKWQAEMLLRQDVAWAERAVARAISAPINQPQFDSLTSFTFNLGSGSLYKSTLRKRVNAGQYLAAANELLKWVNAGGKRLKGLVKRRTMERLLFLSKLSDGLAASKMETPTQKPTISKMKTVAKPRRKVYHDTDRTLTQMRDVRTDDFFGGQ